ncbi:uncharacterized protein [Cherax quadricarinatus]|uniref:uncharacterized protein n=1 Tax=Cherax quadricarinatus TaxID=27406 RepID=UPI00387ECE2E
MVVIVWPRLMDTLKVVSVLVFPVLLHTYIILDSSVSSPQGAGLHKPLQYHNISPPPSLSFFPVGMKSMIVTRNKSWDKLHNEHLGLKDSSKFSETPPKSRTMHDSYRNHSSMYEVTEDIKSDLTNLDNKTTEMELRETLEQLLYSMSTPTYHCRKLITMGGIYCNYKPDGEKHVCYDPDLLPPNHYCLVYSIGVGHDLTFDAQMDKVGCEVFAFDSDVYHKDYPTFISDRLTFYKVRVGTYFLNEFQHQASDKASGPYLVKYWPLPAIMIKLGHTRHQFHYLKLDIEGAEWEVLEESVFKTPILNRTQQLALEVHLDDFRQKGRSRSPQSLLTSATKYLRVLSGLQSRGFHLAHWEPNYKAPELATHVGLTFHVFSETLWVNPSYQKLTNLPAKGKTLVKLFSS